MERNATIEELQIERQDNRLQMAGKEIDALEEKLRVLKTEAAIKLQEEVHT